MSRVIFQTGKANQENAAIWARKRLVDVSGGGRRFTTPDDQDGVLFADSVGLGKTWEALAAAALILYKKRPKAGRRHVLVLCPANLVTKWEDELAPNSPFRSRLAKWEQQLSSSGDPKAARRVRETLTHVLPIRSAKHVLTRRKYGRFHPPGGTYIVSQSLITGRGRGLSALRREEWDIVIVDEAHNAAARKAMAAIQVRRRAHTKLLLTATPFQLDPRELNSLAKNLLKRGSNVLNNPAIARYVNVLADVFEKLGSPDPKPGEVAAASAVLGRLATRTVPQSSKRVYQMLLLDGSHRDLPGRLEQLGDADVASILEQVRRDNDGARDLDFEKLYFRQRIRLATRTEATYVATRLRRMLAAGIDHHESPRRRALELWAAQSLETDLREAIEAGLPRKTIVFTSWVGGSGNGEAAALKAALERSYRTALSATRRHFGLDWDRWKARGIQRLDRRRKAAHGGIASALAALSMDELMLVLAGRHRGFASRLSKALGARDTAIEVAGDELQAIDDRGSFEARSIRRRIRDLRAALSPWTTGRALGAVERYTGSELRSARDRVATAFREVGPPWVLVASNVGSEGIDLHTYTSRIVHFDLEWNPAKMEQREGRGDRVGRRLREKLKILYCIVPRTYDERMFHQLVARDRWHGVLLGKPAAKLKLDGTEARLVDYQRIKNMRLDLAPPRIR